MLIKLVSVHPYPSPQSIPLANAFLKAYALESSVSVCLVDFFIDQDISICAAKCTEPLPYAIGFSMYVWNRIIICEIAAEIRRVHPAVKLFCGGPEVTADTDSVLGTGNFDFVITGEGEVPFLSFCKTLVADDDCSKIPGIHFPDSATAAQPPPLSDLDTIPSPYLTGIIETSATPGILWQLSRGCSFTCDFCFDSRGIHGVRHFSLERMESELRHFVTTGVRQIFVLDSTFNLNPERAKKILRMIRKHAKNIHFHFEVRNEFIDREMAKLFAQISCSLQIGLQSADPEVLKLVGRSFNKTDFTAKTGLLNKSGAVFGFDLIYGLPGDTLAGFRQTLDYALSLYPNHLDIFPLAILPGTRLALRASTLNLIWDREPPYIVKATDCFSCADMSSAAGLAAACDIFYTRGKSVAWFNAVVSVIDMKPSDLLKEFSSWLIDTRGSVTKESELSDDDIWEMQQLFLHHLFRHEKVVKFLPLVLDVASYHHLYAAVLLAQPPETNSEITFDANLCKNNIRFKLASSTRIAHFTYDIEEVLECGEPQISWMYKHLSPSGSHTVLYNNNGMICTEALDLPYIQLLEKIRDEVSGDYISAPGLTRAEALDFLEFALQERIVVYAS